MSTTPETVLFAVDVSHETNQPVNRHWTRLHVIKHAITNFLHAKRWTSPAHRFGLISVQQDTCSLMPLGATSNADKFLEALQLLQHNSPSAAEPAQQQQELTQSSSSSTSSSTHKPFDLGSLVAAVQPLQQSQSHCTPQQQMHGGVLTQLDSHSHGSNTSAGPQQQLRIVLVYCRSRLPAPVWHVHKDAGLAVDCLHIHDKPQLGEQQQELQEVYSTLETLVDRMAVKAGHASLIYESNAKNLGKLLSCMSVMMSHPAQRPPQALAKPPVDLSTADLQLLPSDAANLASGVPIVTPAKLPAAGAWARPLSAGTSTPAAAADLLDSAIGSASAAPATAGGVVTGVPVGCAEGVPDADAPTIAMDLGEGVVVGIKSRSNSLDLSALFPGSTAAASSSGTRDAGAAQTVAGAAAARGSDAELADLEESLRVSAVEDRDAAVFYPKIP